ncbi:hypothetical protein RRG08_060826 [Elysia crispata]|uniref:Uncharacterized protein n=1 Tax=Elysia crispata TaxID=231223 RepID=A0AAE1DF73_9GAST|nr:hypothetical protein RRG08_060826 [Elysia crispata]
MYATLACTIQHQVRLGSTDRMALLKDNQEKSKSPKGMKKKADTKHHQKQDIKRKKISDGYSRRYKSRYTFKHFSDLQARQPSIRLTRHFFGAGHGESLCDCVVKNAASRAVVSGKMAIQSAQNMFDFCSEKIILSSDCPDHISCERTFQLLTTEGIARESHETLEAVKGTQSIHSLFFDSDKAMARDISCFCNTFLLGESGDHHIK